MVDDILTIDKYPLYLNKLDTKNSKIKRNINISIKKNKEGKIYLIYITIVIKKSYGRYKNSSKL